MTNPNNEELATVYPGSCETLRVQLWEAHQHVEKLSKAKTSGERQSNLVDHARRELEHLGCSQDDTDDIVKVVRAFADAGHSGSSASWAIPIINKLLQFQNLTPLTDDPKEWMQVQDGDGAMWQNTRRSEAFSDDGGRSYWLLSEGASATKRFPRHVTQLEKHKREVVEA